MIEDRIDLITSAALKVLGKTDPIDLTPQELSSGLHLAIRYHNLLAVEGLVEVFKANVNNSEVNGKTPIQHAVEAYDDFKYLTPLTIIQKSNADKILSYLARKGADIEILDDNGKTPLMNLINENILTIHTLLNAGADVNKVHPATGNTALHMALPNRDFEFFKTSKIELLVFFGADVNISSNEDIKPLDIIAEFASLSKIYKALNENSKIVPELLLEIFYSNDEFNYLHKSIISQFEPPYSREIFNTWNKTFDLFKDIYNSGNKSLIASCNEQIVDYIFSTIPDTLLPVRRAKL